MQEARQQALDKKYYRISVNTNTKDRTIKKEETYDAVYVIELPLEGDCYRPVEQLKDIRTVEPDNIFRSVQQHEEMQKL